MTVLVFGGGVTQSRDAVDPAWPRSDAREVFWVDLDHTDEAAKRILADTVHVHELAVEGALAESHHPKVEPYDHFLYLILHGMLAGQKHSGFETQDIDFADSPY